jgi:hypothetical protein
MVTRTGLNVTLIRTTLVLLKFPSDSFTLETDLDISIQSFPERKWLDLWVRHAAWARQWMCVYSLATSEHVPIASSVYSWARVLFCHNLRVPYKVANFLTSWATVSFSRKPCYTASSSQSVPRRQTKLLINIVPVAVLWLVMAIFVFFTTSISMTCLFALFVR